MYQNMCVSCRTLQGDIQPPGGIVYQNTSWAFFLGSTPPLVAGQGFIVLKRHCENVAELNQEEQETLGITIAKISQAMSITLQPEKVHFGLYGESVKHIHLHVTPRVSTLPAGNIPIVWLSVWIGILEKLKLRKPISDAAVESVAQRLKIAFERTL